MVYWYLRLMWKILAECRNACSSLHNVMSAKRRNKRMAASLAPSPHSWWHNLQIPSTPGLFGKPQNPLRACPRASRGARQLSSDLDILGGLLVVLGLPSEFLLLPLSAWSPLPYPHGGDG